MPGRGEEGVDDEPIRLLAGVARPGDLRAGPRRQFARRGREAVEDVGDRGELDREQVVQDEGHPLRRGEAVEDDMQRCTHRVREHRLLGGARTREARSGPARSVCSGSPGSSGRGTDALSRSRHNRVTTVVSQAGSESMAASSARSRRSQACWTMSSASAWSPSRRPAMRTRRGRSRSKLVTTSTPVTLSAHARSHNKEKPSKHRPGRRHPAMMRPATEATPLARRHRPGHAGAAHHRPAAP